MWSCSLLKIWLLWIILVHIEPYVYGMVISDCQLSTGSRITEKTSLWVCLCEIFSMDLGGPTLIVGSTIPKVDILDWIKKGQPHRQHSLVCASWLQKRCDPHYCNSPRWAVFPATKGQNKPFFPWAASCQASGHSNTEMNETYSRREAA